jgi:hypothetical protein
MDKHSFFKKALPYIGCVLGLLLGGLMGWIARNRFYVDQTNTHGDIAMVIACVIAFGFLVWVLIKLKDRDGD